MFIVFSSNKKVAMIFDATKSFQIVLAATFRIMKHSETPWLLTKFFKVLILNTL